MSSRDGARLRAVPNEESGAHDARAQSGAVPVSAPRLTAVPDIKSVAIPTPDRSSRVVMNNPFQILQPPERARSKPPTAIQRFLKALGL